MVESCDFGEAIAYRDVVSPSRIVLFTIELALNTVSLVTGSVFFTILREVKFVRLSAKLLIKSVLLANYLTAITRFVHNKIFTFLQPYGR